MKYVESQQVYDEANVPLTNVFSTTPNGTIKTTVTMNTNCDVRAVPGLSSFANDSTIQQALEEAGHQDVWLGVSQLANNREELSA